MDNLPLLLSIVVGIGGVIATYFLIRILVEACLIQSIQTDEEVDNSNEQAISNTVKLIQEAKDEIEMFDDGDFFEESVYNSDCLIETIRSKLDENPHFKIRALFNVPDPNLKFIKEFENNAQVEIYRRKDGSRPRERHYKVIDGGLKGNVSEHHLRATERTYRNFHCIARSKSERSMASKIVLKRIRQPIKLFEIFGGIQ